MVQIIDKEFLLKYNKEQEKSHTIKVYRNHGLSMLKEKGGEIERLANGRQVRRTVSKNWVNYVGSPAEAKMSNLIEHRMKICKANGINTFDKLLMNVSHMPSGASDLWDAMRVDITARILDEPDLTGYIARVVQNDAFTDPLGVQWLLKYVAVFKQIDGRGEHVPMVQIKTGDTDSINFQILGVGFQTDLYNTMFNNIFEMQKVTSAVAEGYILKKNDLVFSPIFDFAYPDNKIIADDKDGSTFEEQMYNTFQEAIKKLGLLMDFQTKNYHNVTSGLSLICHSTRVRDIGRCIGGQLTPGSTIKNLLAINEISRIIPYNTKYQYYGNETITYTGCGINTAYLFIPKDNYYWLALKRDLTHVVGPGDTFGIMGDKEAWYFAPAVWNTQFLGGTAAANDDPTVLTSEHGYIVRMTLPQIADEDT
jgi:hypothetical protein